MLQMFRDVEAFICVGPKKSHKIPAKFRVRFPCKQKQEDCTQRTKIDVLQTTVGAVLALTSFSHGVHRSFPL